MTQNAGLREFCSRCLPTDKRWLALRLICAAIWALELFWLQKLSFPAVPWVRYPLLVQCVRLYLDAILAISLVVLVRRRWLVPLLAANLIAMILLGTYVAHFHRPPMPSRILYELQEAWSLQPHAYDLFPKAVLLLLGLTFCSKLVVLSISGESRLKVGARPRLAAVALLLFFVPVTALQFTHLRLNVRPSAGNGRNVFAYGYTLPWICDLVANRSLQAHARRAERLQARHYDRISPRESPLQIPGHLIILQLESVDQPAIEARVQNQLAMPFLNDLRTRSMSFRLQAFHNNGSCDMDYATITFTEPYAGLVPYRLPGLIYTNSLPAFMKRHGFTSYLFHGNASLFFDRGAVIEHLGFDGLFFKEQLAEKGFKSSIIGYRDRDVFGCILDKLTLEKRACIFAITLDTHVPFKQLDPAEMELYPEPETEVQRYLNSLRYLDNCLRDFVAKLPAGTAVVMYGDHTPSLKSTEYTSDVIDGKEYVGCVISIKGQNLAASQRTRQEPISTDGSLNLLDVMSYLRYSIESADKAAFVGTPPLTPSGE